jgi:hypothetical protein
MNSRVSDEDPCVCSDTYVVVHYIGLSYRVDRINCKKCGIKR